MNARRRAPRGPPPMPSAAWGGAAALLLLLLAAGAARGAPGSMASFAQDWTVPFVHAGNPNPDANYAEIMGSGACVLDYDGDGWQDLLLVNGKYQNASLQQGLDPRTQLYHNDRGRGFTLVPGALNVSAWGMGCAVADYDRDGRPDVAINTWGGPLLFHNDGNGTFRNVTASAGVGHATCGKAVCFGSSIAFLDYDRDGWPDLYALNYVAWDGQGLAAPLGYAGQCNLLYRNLGNGTFRDVSDEAGAADCGRNHLALGIADANGDGWQDIFIASDESSATLLRNNGDGTFTDITVDANVTDNRGGMGAAWGDYDRDGKPDLAVTHFEGETFGLFHQGAGLAFTDRAADNGLGLTRDFVGWGMVFADLNDDGWPDLLDANGHVNVSYGDAHGYGQRNLVWRNDHGTLIETGNGTWLPSAPQRVSRGLALADFDQDGYLDAVFVNNPNQTAELWHNQRLGANALELRLSGNATVNPDAIGAVVTASVAGTTLRQEVQGASSYLSQGSRDVLLGLGEATRVDNLTVWWPDNTTQRFGALDANQLLTLRAGGQPALLRSWALAGAPASVVGNRLDPVALRGEVLRGENATASWSIDGGSATLDGLNATHTFPALGVHTAVLRVTDASGAWDEATEQVEVRDIAPAARVSAPASADRVHASLLDGSASADRDGAVVNWTWSVEGRALYGRTVNATFTALGTAKVDLTVRDDDGSTGTTSAQVQVLDLPPRADAGPDLLGNTRSTFHFNGSLSSDPDGSITAWRWDFGDGNASDAASVQHTYAAQGNYTVTLTVTDDSGSTASDTARVTVDARDAPPVADAGPDREATRVAAVRFDGSASYDPDGSITAWHWDFGDGATASGASVQHTYAALGTFRATLTVTDDTGSRGNATAQVRVVNLAPRLDAGGARQQEGLAPVSFAANATDPDGSIAGIAWDFGDGANATGARAKHAYASFGRYDVAVTALDNDGAATTRHVALWLYAKPVAAMGGDRAADRITDLAFDGRASSDADGRVVAWRWDFGDGTGAEGALAGHRYASLGVFTARLTVTDDDGWTGSASAQVTVRNLPPRAVLDAYDLANVNQTLAYFGTRSSDADGRVASYRWDFGDGATASGAAPRHAFAGTGTREVRLTVTDDDGASASAVLDVRVVDGLAVDVAMDAASYGPLDTPRGWAHVRFANGLPAGGADVHLTFAYRVDLPSLALDGRAALPTDLALPAASVVFGRADGTTDAWGALPFSVPSAVPVARETLPHLGLPTLSALEAQGVAAHDRVAARAAWRGNAGQGWAQFEVDALQGLGAGLALDGRLQA